MANALTPISAIVWRRPVHDVKDVGNKEAQYGSGLTVNFSRGSLDVTKCARTPTATSNQSLQYSFAWEIPIHVARYKIGSGMRNRKILEWWNPPCSSEHNAKDPSFPVGLPELDSAALQRN